jgi:hypothetical protein
MKDKKIVVLVLKESRLRVLILHLGHITYKLYCGANNVRMEVRFILIKKKKKNINKKMYIYRAEITDPNRKVQLTKATFCINLELIQLQGNLKIFEFF